MTTQEPGTEIAGYRIESLIGRGGMAVVYRAEDMRLGRKVALKLLTPQLADSEQFRQRFMRESRLAASLDHPNIVPIYEAGEAEGQLFIAMRYVVGSDLKGVLTDEGGRLPLPRMMRLFAQIGDALDAAHRAGLVHRDVKPGNILITGGPEHTRAAHGDHVYLTDFGLTKRTSELTGGLTGTGNFLGTVNYVAPEQIQGKPVGPGTDIYALGCVLYECLTGQLPFHRDDDAALLWAHLVETPAPVSGIRPEVPSAVDAVVARTMAKDPADRYESSEELMHDLERALGMPAPRTAPADRQDKGRETATVLSPPGSSPAGRPDGSTQDRSRADQSRADETSHDGASQAGTGQKTGGRHEATVLAAATNAGDALSYSLAIDLGTSFIAAAVADDRGLEMFSLGDGSLVEPAAVYVRGDGRLLTGEAAARRAVSHPDRFAREIKRNLANPTPIMLGGSPYAVSDLLGALLQDVLGHVTERQGAKPEVVALTHPANWGPFRRELFEDVAQSAGLTDPLYTTEPEAAAAHFASTRPLGEGEVLAVYDLGGGTFDATVLRRTAHGFEIVGTPEGIERLGGADFDDAIFAHVNYLAGGALGELDLSDPRTVIALARLRQDCTLAKEALSVDAEATIPVFLPNRHFEVTLTRRELEGMIRGPIESTIGTVDRVLRAAQVDRTMLAAVLLVGGSSRIPLVAQMVSEAFGRPTVVGAHPKHAVALGAALLAEARRKKAPVALLAGTAGQLAESLTVGDDVRAGSVPPTEAVAAPRAAAPVSSPAAPPVPRPAPAEGPGPAHGQGQDQGRVIAPVFTPGWHGGPGGPGGSGGPAGPAGPGGWPGPGGPPPGAMGGEVPPGQPAEPRPGRRKLLVAAAAALLAVVLGVVLVMVILKDDRGSPTTGGQSSAASSTEGPGPAPSPTAPPQAAVPIPSIGGEPIPVGNTPGFVAVSPNGKQLYVANRAAGVITVVDTAVDAVTATIPVPAGPPQFLTFAPDGSRLYVSVFNDERTIAAVAVLDTADNSIVTTIPVKTRPYRGAVTPDGKRLFVPNHDSGSISVIDTATNTVIKEVSVPPNPHWIEFTADGSRAYVANHESNVITQLDPNTLEVVASIPVGKSPHSLAVHPTRPLVANVNYDSASVTMIDTTNNTVVATIPVPENPQNIVWSADGRFAYVCSVTADIVSVINAEDFTVTARLPVGDAPTSTAVLPDGSRAYVSVLNAGTLVTLDLAG